MNWPFGEIAIQYHANSICRIQFETQWENCSNPLVVLTTHQINEYLIGKRKTFDIPFSLCSFTEFTTKVLLEIAKIPYGQTVTYKELAYRIGNPKAYRAVGTACGKNPIPIIIPCHRVVAGNSIGGFSSNIAIKKWLLELENPPKAE